MHLGQPDCWTSCKCNQIALFGVTTPAASDRVVFQGEGWAGAPQTESGPWQRELVPAWTLRTISCQLRLSHTCLPPLTVYCILLYTSTTLKLNSPTPIYFRTFLSSCSLLYPVLLMLIELVLKVVRVLICQVLFISLCIVKPTNNISKPSCEFQAPCLHIYSVCFLSSYSCSSLYVSGKTASQDFYNVHTSFCQRWFLNSLYHQEKQKIILYLYFDLKNENIQV